MFCENLGFRLLKGCVLLIFKNLFRPEIDPVFSCYVSEPGDKYFLFFQTWKSFENLSYLKGISVTDPHFTQNQRHISFLSSTLGQ